MKTSPHPQQSFMSEQLEAWVLDDFRDLPLFRKSWRINPSGPSGAAALHPPCSISICSSIYSSFN